MYKKERPLKTIFKYLSKAISTKERSQKGPGDHQEQDCIKKHEVTQINKISFHTSSSSLRMEKPEHNRLYPTGLHSSAPASDQQVWSQISLNCTQFFEIEHNKDQL